MRYTRVCGSKHVLTDNSRLFRIQPKAQHPELVELAKKVVVAGAEWFSAAKEFDNAAVNAEVPSEIAERFSATAQPILDAKNRLVALVLKGKLLHPDLPNRKKILAQIALNKSDKSRVIVTANPNGEVGVYAPLKLRRKFRK